MTTRQFKRTAYCLGVLGLWLALATPAFAAPPAKPACKTSGPLVMSAISPAQYAYTIGESGQAAYSLAVTAPPANVNNCDTTLAPVFGNSESSSLAYELKVTEIVDELGSAVDASTAAAIRGALSAFETAPFQLTLPGNASQAVTFSFTNSHAIPVGTYDVSVQAKPDPGTGVGAASGTFTIKVEELQLEDTQAPTVNIVSPVTGAALKINDTLAVNFTATDPPENGAGTGVGAARASITSCSGSFTYDLTSPLVVSPALPVAADVLVTASTSIAPWLYVGNFTLTAEADDAADHTGSAAVTFSSGVGVEALPPISVTNRQFNSGSTLPIKFVLRDGAGELLPPMDGLVVRITAPNGTSDDRVAGSGAANVRWDVDEYGMVTQYITNYAIPTTGTYVVEILVGDVCGASATQGSFNFVAASKGGKQ